jgi:multidrug efflux pump subunit AcrA (membrane-fusion protein)
MRKIILFVLGVLVVLGSGYLTYNLFNTPKEVKKVNNLNYKPISVDTVKNKTIPIIITTNGIAVATNKFDLFSEVEGVFRYSAKTFRAGQKFKKGEILLRIDAEEFKANVISARSEFFNILVSVIPDIKLDFPDEFAEWQSYLNNFDVEKTVKQLPSSSKQLKYFITGRGIFSSYYNIKNLETRLGKFTIRAPFDGVLSEAVINPGTLVRPGQRLGEFIEPSSYEVEISLQKSVIPFIKENDTVTLNALDNTITTSGIITRINNQIDQQTQTVQIFVRVNDNSVQEGQYLSAKIEAQTIQDAVEINRSLLKNNNQIFVVKDSVLAYKTVNPVYYYEQKAIVKGLEDGDVIMTSNLSSAYPEMLVKTE